MRKRPGPAPRAGGRKRETVVPDGRIVGPPEVNDGPVGQASCLSPSEACPTEIDSGTREQSRLLPESSDPVVNDADAVAQLFGPGSKTSIIAESDAYDIPDEVQEALQMHGLANRQYRCTLKAVTSGESTVNASYITSWSSCIPTVEWVAKHYGPGDYILWLSWLQYDPETGKQKRSAANIPLTISEKYQDEYEEFQLKQRVQRAQRNRATIQNAKLRKELETSLGDETIGTNTPDQRELVKGYIGEFRELAQIMGWNAGGNGGGFNWGDLAKTVLTGLPALLGFMASQREKQQEQLMQFMTLLMNQSSSSVGQLVEVMKAQAGPSSGREMLQDFKEMVMGAVDIKQALADKEEGVIDKVLNVVDRAAPFLAQLVMLKQSQREQQPMYKMAQAYVAQDPNIQRVAQDPDLLAEMVEKLDAHYGWQQTDMILHAMQKERPSQCPRRPEQAFPAGDPRNQTDRQDACPTNRQDACPSAVGSADPGGESPPTGWKPVPPENFTETGEEEVYPAMEGDA